MNWDEIERIEATQPHLVLSFIDDDNGGPEMEDLGIHTVGTIDSCYHEFDVLEHMGCPDYINLAVMPVTGVFTWLVTRNIKLS